MARPVRTLICFELVYIVLCLSSYAAGFVIHPDSIYRRMLYEHSLNPDYASSNRDVFGNQAKRDNLVADEVAFPLESDYGESSLEYPEADPLLYDGDDVLRDIYHTAKRTIAISNRSRMPVAFHCTPFSAKCRNGGVGPKITPTKKRKTICVCLCPQGYRGAQCTKFKRP